MNTTVYQKEQKPASIHKNEPDKSIVTDADSSVHHLVKLLIARPSVTPNDEGCQALLTTRLQQCGFHCEHLPVNGVTNLWARRGNAQPLFVFAGHTDVVPPGPRDKWDSDPFIPSEREGFLYGRGAADMKTSIAAFVVAVEEFINAHPDHSGSIAFLLTSDEEGPSVDGTVRVCEWLQAQGKTLDYCIVGEPTSEECLGDVSKHGRRGSLSGELTVLGTQGHVAYPHRARNAIHALAPALTELVNTQWDEGNACFPATTFQVSNLSAGTGANNVIPGEATVLFNFRFSPASTPDNLKMRLTQILDQHGLTQQGLTQQDLTQQGLTTYNIKWHLGGEPFLTPLDGTLTQALAQAIHAETGVTVEFSTTGGTSDGRFIAKICPQVLEFGPCNATIHKVNERVEIASLEPLKNIYRRTLEYLLP